MNLHDKLKDIDTYPFHMPGHKRNDKFGILGSEIDITEIDGFDNLHSPNGVIKNTDDKLKSIYKSERSFISVNGSSGGILAAIFAVCNEGHTVIVARNCHKSVYNACVLLKLKIIFIEPQYDFTNGYYTNLKQDTVNSAISRHPEANAVIITSPTYEGFVSDIKCDIPLIIDAAHGAHFGMPYFPKYPSGDIVISSLHKTLPSLTQTAVVNVFNKKYADKVKRYMDIFQTSSPSYVLMNSIDICCDYVLNCRNEFGKFYEKLCDLRLVETDNLKIQYNDDISKIVLSCASTNITGSELAENFRSKYKIEPEAVSQNYILLMATIGDTDEGLALLKKAVFEIDSQLEYSPAKPIRKPPVEKGKIVLSIDENAELCDIDKSVGRVSNEFVYAYPPDIPIISPNETITSEVIEYIKNAMADGVNIISDSGQLPNKILTKVGL